MRPVARSFWLELKLEPEFRSDWPDWLDDEVSLFKELLDDEPELFSDPLDDELCACAEVIMQATQSASAAINCFFIILPFRFVFFSEKRTPPPAPFLA
ncbi:MAG TPA: hypothetical protein VHH88_03610 [Verrucomicrobiae bacterium]|nr:hypothetical protein [Verrucomicrobiae bacterium]